ncbi:DUF971 domain-containing protein [Aureliella helgolandensis]|uniref:Gamma-butyrobetaine hydroxylase-like N-terminal domain-containing protein n=1 Tax=Aureliella helgolandensis TaxID=2527968 RepID=A0A518GCJ2_9BACT|nr:DUF971 domain-containing protein [Aureliella helgolandensis]QDV26314.1 hypothetical protein Q31a_46860 [Aureliella helgolandensis]
MELIPTALSRHDDGKLRIEWSDGSVRIYTPAKLRAICPCATCREKRSATSGESPKPRLLPVLSIAETQPIQVTRMRPVGNYAYNIGFSDGHDSGIFTFDFLHEVGQSPEAA